MREMYDVKIVIFDVSKSISNLDKGHGVAGCMCYSGYAKPGISRIN